jgi:lysozyme family protein
MTVNFPNLFPVKSSSFMVDRVQQNMSSPREVFNRAIAFILPSECEYARGHWGDMNYVVTENVPGDSGGLTKFGVDQASHPKIDIANLTQEGAIDIYWDEWQAHNLDLLPDRLAIAAFDVWVNGGHASKWLQHAYNVTHPNFEQLTEDGELGPKSIFALKGSNQDEILAEFFKQRDARFHAIATGERARFLAGWLQRDFDLKKFLVA